MKHIIPITPPYSLDKNWDAGDPMENPGSMKKLTNYIPDQDVLRVRKGITTFSFDTEDYDPLSDPNLLMWLRMESNSTLDDCEIQGADYMTNSGPVSADISDYWEGSGSAFIDHYGDNQTIYRAVTGLPTGFPARNGEGGYLITFFFELDHFPDAVSAKIILYKDGVPGGSDIMGSLLFGATRDITDSYPCPYFTPYDRFGASTFFRSDANLWGGAYHCGIWVSQSLGLAGIRTYRISNGNITNNTIACSGTSYDNTAGKNFSIGHTRFRGWIDDVMIFDEAPPAEAAINEKIDSIRERLGYS